MEREKTVCLIPLIILVTAISGCVTPVSGNGVIVEDFKSDFTQVYSGETVHFDLLIRNAGSVDALNVFAEILGIDEAWHDESVGNWLNRENLPNEPECRYTGTGFNLLAPDPVYGTPGETHICTWTYKAPELPTGTSLTYHPKARIFYDYMTSVVKFITILPKADARALQDQGKTFQVTTASTTNSPIQIDIETSRSIRTLDNSVEFPITIKIDNVGGGTVCLLGKCKKPRDSEWNKMIINIKLGLKTGTTGTNLQLLDCNPQETIDLYGGMANTITCRILATNLPAVPTQRAIEVSSEYSYFVDKTISVDVFSGYEVG